MKLTGVLCALVACGRSEPAARPPSEPPPPPPIARDAAVAIDASARDAATAGVLPATTTQLVTAIVPDWTSTTAELRLWQRAGTGWRATGPAWPGVVGKSGAAWGAGLHGAGAPAGRAGPVKREGDGKSPAGVFALAGSYGYAAQPPPGTALPYTQVGASWKCVDDPASPQYNRILDQRTTQVDWTSAEAMRRSDELYTWVVDVAHNPRRIGGEGSCIFLHVWRGPGSVTVGCTAMDAGKLAALIATLSPAHAPAFVLLPRAEYDALADGWGLPSLGRPPE